MTVWSITSAPHVTGPLRGNKQRDRRDDERRELAGGPQELTGHDQEDRAERGSQHSAAAAEHGRYDHVHADCDIDHGADRGGAEVEHQQCA
jgi:hypothetical protein